MSIKSGSKVKYVGDNPKMKNVVGTVRRVLPVGTSPDNKWVEWVTDDGKEARSTTDSLAVV